MEELIFYKYAEMFDEKGVTTDIVIQAIQAHADLKEAMKKKYGRYRQDPEYTPIFEGKYEKNTTGIDNMLANDYFGEIVDTKAGYIFGIPMDINYDKNAPSYDLIADTIRRFKETNNLDDLNAEWCKHAAICGYDAALCYVDKEGEGRVIRLDPWETMIISKTSITEPDYAIHYFKTWDDKFRAEVYTSKFLHVFEGNSFSELTEIERKANRFDGCPIVGFPNNEELQGDGDKVFTLIDAYDRAASNMADENDIFRLAYLLFIGYEIDEETLRQMVETGALYIPDATEGQRIEWLTKNLDPKYVESLLDRLEANVTRFAKHVDFTDAAFGSDITGPAMRFKLFSLETKSKYFERKHTAALKRIFKVMSGLWKIKAIPFDYTLLEFKYTRNIPVNLLEATQTATALKGLTSLRTALSVLPNVPDPDEEIRAIEEDKTLNIDLDEEIDNNNDDGEDDDKKVV